MNNLSFGSIFVDASCYCAGRTVERTTRSTGIGWTQYQPAETGDLQPAGLNVFSDE
jgi:hypothetical protein